MQTNTASQDTPSKERLAQNLRHLVDEADALMKNAVNAGEHQVDATRAKLESQLRQLRTQIDDIEDTLVHRTRKAVRATDEAVHAHPYTAIGIAGLAGVLLGALLARR
jgi:ElaB/YqjD/DUF883 family membrane-anchored ribosome-binding protein